MSIIEKTISFRAVDNGTSNVIQKLRKETEGFADDILQSALKQSQSGKEFVRNVEEQIKVLEKRHQLVRQLNAEAVKEKYNDLRADIAGHYDDRKSKINDPIKESRDIAFAKLEAQKKKDIQGTIANERDELNRINTEDSIQVKLLRELIQTVKEEADKEIENNRKQAEQNAKADKETPIEEGEDVKARARARFQRDALGIDNEKSVGEDKKTWQEIAKGILAADAVKQALRLITGSINTLGSGQTGDYIATGLVNHWIGTDFGIKTHLQYLHQQQTAYGRLRGTTGNEDGFGGMNELGYNSMDTAGLAEQIAKGRGYGGRSLKTSTTSIASLIKGYNLDQGSTLGLENMSGYNNGGHAIDATLNMINTLKTKGVMEDDYSKLSKLMETEISILQEQTGYLSRLDSDKVAMSLSSLMKIGGAFDSSNRVGGFYNNINSSLRGPSNDYQKAMNYSVLSRLNPNADFWDIQKMESRGIQEPGFLRGTMDLLTQQSGGNKKTAYQLAQTRFGLSPEITEDLVNGYQNYTDNDLIRITEGKGTTLKKCIKNTSEQSKQQSAIDDAFAISALKGLETAGTQAAESFGKAVHAKEMGTLIGAGFLDSVIPGLSNIYNLFTKKHSSAGIKK